jgi:hypothetical protein
MSSRKRVSPNSGGRGGRSGSKRPTPTATGTKRGGGGDEDREAIKPAGYLISCDVPTKQFIRHLNEEKAADKRFIVQDLDEAHVLVREEAVEEIQAKVKEWLDKDVYSALETVGEDLDMS